MQEAGRLARKPRLKVSGFYSRRCLTARCGNIDPYIASSMAVHSTAASFRFGHRPTAVIPVELIREVAAVALLTHGLQVRWNGYGPL
jgi:hypothetical protein